MNYLKAILLLSMFGPIANMDLCEVYVLPVTKDMVAFYGKTASFQAYVYPIPDNCLGIDKNNVTWIKIGGTIPSNRVEMTYNSDDLMATMKLRALEEGDLGSYRCDVEYKGTQYQSSEITLDLKTKPEVTPLSSVVTAVEGSTVNLNVTVTADPAPTSDQIIWDTLKIPWSDERFKVSDDAHSLTIYNLSMADSGAYFSCEVRTDYATDRAYIKITVLELPKITSISPNTTLFEDTATLRCETSGDPAPTITWTLANGSIVITTESTISVYPILEGWYSCNATNSAGSVEKSLYLKKGDIPVIIAQTSPHYIAKAGDTLNITCLAEGAPQPSVFWSLAGTNISQSSNLLMTSFQTSDQGTYTCTASNLGGTATSNTVVKIAGEPRITLSKQNATVSEGNDVTIICSSVSDPPSTNKWVHNITTISTSDEGLPLALDLNTVTLQQAGQYYCVSNNGYHEGSSAFTLTVYKVPTSAISITKSTVELGTDIALTCAGQGVPEPVVEWYKDGVRAAGGVRAADGASVLQVQNSLLNDSGVYECRRWNNFGNATDTATVIITSKPYWVTEFDTTMRNVTVGSVMEYPCSVTGYPKPGIELIGGTSISDGLVAMTTNDSITSVSVGCRASNVYGAVEETFQLYVHQPLFVPEEAPLAVHVFIETEGYVLSCPIQGHPAVNRVIWTTPNNTIVDTEGPLTLSKIALTSGGDYTCVASNEWGMSTTVTLTLIVDYDKPNVTLDFADAPISKVGVITCIGYGRPVVQLQLSHEGEEFVNGTVHTATDPRLGLYVVLTYTYIMSNEHAGQWSCQATNEVGDVDTKNFTLNHITIAAVQLSEPIDRSRRYNDTKPTAVYCNSTGTASLYTSVLINGVNCTLGSTVAGVIVLKTADNAFEIKVAAQQLGTTTVVCQAQNKWGSNSKTTTVTNSYSLACYKCVTRVCAAASADISIAHIIAVYPSPRSVEWIAPEGVKFTNSSIQIDPGFIEYEANIKNSDVTTTIETIRFEIVDSGGTPLTVETILQIFEPLSVILLPPSDTVWEGDNVTVTASVTASPMPSFAWRVNGVNISESDPSTAISASHLTIMNVRGGDVFQVTLVLTPVSSCHTARSQSITINVYGRNSLSIYSLPTVVTMNYGKRLELVCKAAGEPTPFITWRKDGGSVLFSGDRQASLIIHSMSESSNGRWECKATNSIGQSDSHYVDIIADAKASTNNKDSGPSKELLLFSSLTVALIVFVTPLILTLYCLKMRREEKKKPVTPATDSGYEERISLDKEIRKLITPEHENYSFNTAVPTSLTPNTPNPALFINPDASNRLPPLPRRCSSAQTIRSHTETPNRPRSATHSSLSKHKDLECAEEDTSQTLLVTSPVGTPRTPLPHKGTVKEVKEELPSLANSVVKRHSTKLDNPFMAQISL